MRPESEIRSVELLRPDGNPSGIWQCLICRTGWPHPVQAANCCSCMYCHLPLDTKRHYGPGLDSHPTCKANNDTKNRRRREDAAEKVDSWDGWVYSEDGGGSQDGYFDSLDSFMEWCEEDDDRNESAPYRPTLVWTCDEEPFPGLDLDDLIENLAENLGYEDADDAIEGKSALGVAIKAFNDANERTVSYHQNHKRMVRVPWPDEATEEVAPCSP